MRPGAIVDIQIITRTNQCTHSLSHKHVNKQLDRDELLVAPGLRGSGRVHPVFAVALCTPGVTHISEPESYFMGTEL